MSLDAWQTVETDAIGNGMLLVFGVVIAGAMRGLWRRVNDALHAQKEITEAHRQIIDQLDPTTPGGLGDIDVPLRPEAKQRRPRVPPGFG